MLLSIGCSQGRPKCTRLQIFSALILTEVLFAPQLIFGIAYMKLSDFCDETPNIIERVLEMCRI